MNCSNMPAVTGWRSNDPSCSMSETVSSEAAAVARGEIYLRHELERPVPRVAEQAPQLALHHAFGDHQVDACASGLRAVRVAGGARNDPLARRTGGAAAPAGDLELSAYRKLQPKADRLTVGRDNHLYRRPILDVPNIAPRQIDAVDAHIELRRLLGAERKAVSCPAGIGMRLFHVATVEDAVSFQERGGAQVHVNPGRRVWKWARPSPTSGVGNLPDKTLAVLDSDRPALRPVEQKGGLRIARAVTGY